MIPHVTMGTKSFFFKGSSTLLCSASFFSTISTASLVRSSMDCFIKVVPEKKDAPDDTIHEELISKIRVYLSFGRNVLLCGPHGVGKTFVVNRTLGGECIHILPEHLKSKNIFLDCIKSSKKHCVLEDIHVESGFKGMIEKISDGLRITKGSVIGTSTEMYMYPGFETIYMSRHAPETLMRLRPSARWEDAVRADGNIQNFLSYTDERSDTKDIFKTGKELITELLCDGKKKYDRDKAFEHGNMLAMFQENYLDSEGVNYVGASYSFSDADLLDSAIYDGNWEAMAFFVNSAFCRPKQFMGAPLRPQEVRAGSCWTRHGNYKMRQQRVRTISQLAAPYTLGVDELCLLRKHAQMKNFDILLDYNITPQAFDIMNHLCVNNKLKQREVSNIKKQLKHVLEQREG
jgi:hypothetical protein